MGLGDFIFFHLKILNFKRCSPTPKSTKVRGSGIPILFLLLRLIKLELKEADSGSPHHEGFPAQLQSRASDHREHPAGGGDTDGQRPEAASETTIPRGRQTLAYLEPPSLGRN